MEELKKDPCPFCDANKTHFEQGHKQDCPFTQIIENHEGEINVSKEQELSAWNTRATVSHADLQAALDDLLIPEDSDGAISISLLKIDKFHRGYEAGCRDIMKKLKALLEPQTNKEA